MSSMSSSTDAGLSANATIPTGSPTILDYATPKPPRKVGLLSLEAWTPLAVPLFRWLWVATMMNYVATAARDVAASPWLMARLTAGLHNGPFFVALVTTASTLPICIFSLFAGALADLMDRRRLLIITQVWMVIISVILGLLTWCIGWAPGACWASRCCWQSGRRPRVLLSRRSCPNWSRPATYPSQWA